MNAAVTFLPPGAYEMPRTAFWRSTEYTPATRRKKAALWREIVDALADAYALQDAKRTHSTRGGKRRVPPALEPNKNRALKPRTRPAPRVKPCPGPGIDFLPACGGTIPPRTGGTGGARRRCVDCAATRVDRMKLQSDRTRQQRKRDLARAA